MSTSFSALHWGPQGAEFLLVGGPHAPPPLEPPLVVCSQRNPGPDYSWLSTTAFCLKEICLVVSEIFVMPVATVWETFSDAAICPSVCLSVCSMPQAQQRRILRLWLDIELRNSILKVVTVAETVPVERPSAHRFAARYLINFLT